MFKKSVSRNGLITVCGLLIWGASPAAGGDEQPLIMESFPQHLQARLDQTEIPASIEASISRSVLDLRKLWPAGKSLKVCFAGGGAGIHRRIARAALEWTKFGNIRLDFGPETDSGVYRRCTSSDQSEIRVSFSYNGYWSLVGTDSKHVANPGEATMNFEQFNINPPQEPGFTATVLHEFGHALGFHHEHQSPGSNCDEEFDWEKIYEYLQGPPNYWDPDTIDFNLRQLSNSSAYRFSTHDRKSIMHYSFPAWMCKEGNDSACCVEESSVLSEQDKLAMNDAYPAANVESFLADRARGLLEVLDRTDLDFTTRQVFQAQLGELSAGRRSEARP